MVRKLLYLILIISITASATGCRNTTIPKPAGYFRIDLPAKKYQTLEKGYPYSFEYPAYGIINKATGQYSEPNWINIDFPAFKACIHISYKDVRNNLGQLTEDAHNLSYKHSIKADAIEEKVWTNDSTRVYGILYDVKGNAASALQFYMTDSTTHYLRGSLYFMAEPNEDSLKPVIDFFREDIIHLIETLVWKNN